MIKAYTITHGICDIELVPKQEIAAARHLDKELRGHSYKLLKQREKRSTRANAFLFDWGTHGTPFWKKC